MVQQSHIARTRAESVIHLPFNSVKRRAALQRERLADMRERDLFGLRVKTEHRIHGISMAQLVPTELQAQSWQHRRSQC